jgi:hypothetical protein
VISGTVANEVYPIYGPSNQKICMHAQDVLDLLREDPFVPFSIHMSDGSKYEIRHPAMAIVELSKVTISLPADRSPDLPADRTIRVSLAHINRIEPIAEAKKGRGTRRKTS